MTPSLKAESSVCGSTKRNSELQSIDDPRKAINRRATVLEIGSQLHLIPRPSIYKESTNSILTTIPLHYFSSPAPSYTSAGGTPNNSVRFNESDSDIAPEQYHLHMPKRSSKSTLKPCKPSADMPSLFERNGIISASEAIEYLLYDFAGCVKNFRCPDEHDFSTIDDNQLLFTQIETNKPFINQPCRMGDIRARSADTSIQGDTWLEGERKAAGMTLKRTFQKMKEQQIKLLHKFDYKRTKAKAEATRSLDLLHADLIDCIKKFGLPSSLDFLEDPEGMIVLPSTVKNRSFINQLNELERFRDELNKIPTHENARLKNKHSDITVALGQTLQGMKKIQVELYELKGVPVVQAALLIAGL
ncbi:hypothetical protein OPQ81_011893 [Rhizoctonia solani]|nr:hypothetical protein OPQ81_011893 [Rhizoctonia solani]